MVTLEADKCTIIYLFVCVISTGMDYEYSA
jgi:hypothetical protein